MSNLLKSKELRIGVFAIASIVGLYFLINYFKGKDLFSGTHTYYAVYDNVSGLTSSSPVYILGLKAGSVDEILFRQNDKKMQVRMRLDRHYQLPIGTSAEIYSADVLGSKAIRIQFANNDRIHTSGDTLTTIVSEDMINKLLGSLTPLKDQVAAVLTRLDTTLARVNLVLEEPNRSSIAGSIKNLESSMQHIQSLAASLDAQAPSISNTLSQLDSITASLSRPDGSLQQTLDNLASLSAQLEDASLGEAVQSLKNLLDNIQNPDGSLGKLMENDALYTGLNNVLQKVDSLVQKITDNPKKYIRISIF